MFHEQKSTPVKLSLFHLFGKTFSSPPLKSLSCKEIGSRVLDSWYYVEKRQRKRVALYCYQKLIQTNFFKKNFGTCSPIGCFKVRNWTRKILTPRQSPLNDMLYKKKSVTGNLAHQKVQRENLHQLFDCLRTPLNHFLACLTFNRKEIQLRQLHERTNPGSTPESDIKETDITFLEYMKQKCCL